ncbi:uncharacterized protein PGTG_00103 [Puccinia graminis f. sp. tritici CRL 75-36-700-3]|uniref:Uncharacterized protein n=1 Tax=Puccinia graminis f. sp. tritici (strain CRL 75-36-700-3 / race SCCL) TaxID=418459 RepID=E3JQ64_PUCGT|nr:uncharacterized protein PGTG_00103 [Puccinia graminis f. sp. tritici CRL 75-36-700-3]EFP74147.1 hypothetical protein PGTG_00103 [Puccinia graminis f. sp. tritici CRL 75-36-700-3]
MASPDNLGTRKIKQRIKPISAKNQIKPIQSFFGWQTAFKNQPESKKKRKKTQSILGLTFRQSEIIPSTVLFRAHQQTIPAGATGFAPLALNGLDQNLKKNSWSDQFCVAGDEWVGSEIQEGVEATSFASLSFACLVWNTSRKRKKRLISNHLRWMYQRNKKRKGLILHHYMLKSLDFSWTFTRKIRAEVVLNLLKKQDRKRETGAYRYLVLDAQNLDRLIKQLHVY